MSLELEWRIEEISNLCMNNLFSVWKLINKSINLFYNLDKRFKIIKS